MVEFANNAARYLHCVGVRVSVLIERAQDVEGRVINRAR
jgi:hypothetical protein